MLRRIIFVPISQHLSDFDLLSKCSPFVAVALADNIFPTVLLKMIGAMEQKNKEIAWQLAAIDLEFRRNLLKKIDKKGSYNYKDSFNFDDTMLLFKAVSKISTNNLASELKTLKNNALAYQEAFSILKQIFSSLQFVHTAFSSSWDSFVNTPFVQELNKEYDANIKIDKHLSDFGLTELITQPSEKNKITEYLKGFDLLQHLKIEHNELKSHIDPFNEKFFLNALDAKEAEACLSYFDLKKFLGVSSEEELKNFYNDVMKEAPFTFPENNPDYTYLKLFYIKQLCNYRNEKGIADNINKFKLEITIKNMIKARNAFAHNTYSLQSRHLSLMELTENPLSNNYFLHFFALIYVDLCLMDCVKSVIKGC